MSSITDLKTLKANAASLDADLRAVFAKYGLKMDGRNAKIGDGVCEFKIKTKYGSSEDERAREERTWQTYAGMLGVDPGAFGKRFRIQGDVFEVAGAQPNKPKNCVKLVRVKDGKTFQCPASTLNNARAA